MDEKAGEKIRSEAARQVALELIRSESTLVLATVGPSGPWVAPVYYVFQDGAFTFFSNPDSRHIRQATADGRAAATIFHPSDAWRQICGLQMAGRIEPVRSITTGGRAIAIYLQRYPFVRDFFPTIRQPNLQTFFSRFNVKLYSFAPVEIHLTDNRTGLGKRQPIHLDGSVPLTSK